jgi:hypothetical protein
MACDVVKPALVLVDDAPTPLPKSRLELAEALLEDCRREFDVLTKFYTTPDAGLFERVKVFLRYSGPRR